MTEAKRYYAQIMMPYHNWAAKHLDAAASRKLRLIAPSHGPVWDRPDQILNAYRDWTSAPQS